MGGFRYGAALAVLGMLAASGVVFAQAAGGATGHAGTDQGSTSGAAAQPAGGAKAQQPPRTGSAEPPTGPNSQSRPGQDPAAAAKPSASTTTGDESGNKGAGAASNGQSYPGSGPSE